MRDCVIEVLWLMFAACEPLRAKVELMEEFASVA